MTTSQPPPQTAAQEEAVPQTLREALNSGAEDIAALVTPDGEVITYRKLRREVDRLSQQLRASGLSAGDRIAIVMPNSPEMAVAFLVAACVGCAAPLNPRYRAAELRFYLEDLAVKALITMPDESGSEAREAAQSTSGDVLSMTLEGSAAAGGGSLNFQPALHRHCDSADGLKLPTGDDVGLVLHTSGTTSRPKIVPLRQRNLACSAASIAESLALTPKDRSLQVMPLFHIHGLLAGLLAPLSAGATVACTEGFDAFKFFAQLKDLKPSYYTAVPTMHQMVLSRAGRHRDQARAAGLRFVRSSSASLPSPVLTELAELFDAPVVESYGMTEATHQMCANPLPPAVAKPRSVGIPTGVELAILDPQNRRLPAGERGEVSIKGPAVIDGYENNPEANAAAFTNGWFRTGDEGYLDTDGYLFLTGRFKEQINRGGEKVSPLEVDESLLAHPQVAQAVTFAMAHPKLGEEVAAAVVPVNQADPPSEQELRSFVAQSLAGFKVPRRILVLDELPKGATGKLQRIGLADRLGLNSAISTDSSSDNSDTGTEDTQAADTI